MKKILLRVASVRSEMCRRKMPQALFRYAAARKIKLTQSALNPDVHRERRVKTIGEQQNAIGNFAAYTG